MATQDIPILLVEGNPGDVRRMRAMLAAQNGSNGQFALQGAEQVSTALSRLADEDFGAVLLDLSRADSRGLATVHALTTAAPEVPVVVLTDRDDDSLAVRAAQAGAQDYLVKGKVTAGWLSRAIAQAIVRHRIQVRLRTLAFTDELTGLYNRRGFQTLAEQQLKLARRMHTDLFLCFVDLDDLKRINDSCGHQAGDLALIQTADLLRETFRSSDIVARWGGDEFAVLAIGASRRHIQVLTARLFGNLARRNARIDQRYPLYCSVGVAHFDPAAAQSLDELIAQADEALYANKQPKCHL